MKAARGRARSINRKDIVMAVCHHDNGDVELFLSSQKRPVLLLQKEVEPLIYLLDIRNRRDDVSEIVSLDHRL